MIQNTNQTRRHSSALRRKTNMKLSKAKLIKQVKPHLERLGFTEFKDTIEGTQGLFIKKINEFYYLSLGLSIHRYYDTAFTGDYYLSKTTRWGAVWGDIPDKSYERPSFLLTQDERSIYPTDEINVKGSYDIWWDGSDEQSVLDFLRVIELTESRFVNQIELINQIEHSQDVKTLSEYANKVKDTVWFINLKDSYSFLPSKEIDDIPMSWFMASEVLLKKNNGILNSNTVKQLAGDAFRQYKLTQLSEMKFKI